MKSLMTATAMITFWGLGGLAAATPSRTKFVKPWIRLLCSMILLLGLLGPVDLKAQPCYPLPPATIPFTSLYSISAPNGAGDRLVVGTMVSGVLDSLPLPNAANQKFCEMVQLAPGFFAEAYVPTAAERSGNFSDFAGLLLDPLNNEPFPAGIIPQSRFFDPFAWRISSTMLTFPEEVSSGMTTVTISSAGPTPPAGFQVGNPPTYYDITTTSSVTGQSLVCIGYSGVSFSDETTLALFHFEGGTWIDRTISRDADADLICARVDSLSPFAIFEPAPSPAERVAILISDVKDLVVAGRLRPQWSRPLERTLVAAAQKLSRGNTKAAIVLLRAFALEIRLLVQLRQFAPEDGSSLLESTTLIINQLQP